MYAAYTAVNYMIRYPRKFTEFYKINYCILSQVFANACLSVPLLNSQSRIHPKVTDLVMKLFIDIVEM